MQIQDTQWNILELREWVKVILDRLYITKKWHPIRSQFKTKDEHFVINRRLWEYSKCSGAIFPISDYNPYESTS